MDSHDAPEMAFSLDLRGLRAWIEVEDGDTVLHLSDGNQHIAVETGAGGSAEEMIKGADRLADMTQQFRGLLERHRPVDWWTPPEVVATPYPPNAGGF